MKSLLIVFCLFVSTQVFAAGGKSWSIGISDAEGASLKYAFGQSKKHVLGLSYGSNSIGVLSTASLFSPFTAYGLVYSWHWNGYGTSGMYAKLLAQSATVTTTVTTTNYSGTTVLAGGYVGYQSFWGWFSMNVGLGARSPVILTLNRTSGGGAATYSATLSPVLFDFGIAAAF